MKLFTNKGEILLPDICVDPTRFEVRNDSPKMDNSHLVKLYYKDTQNRRLFIYTFGEYFKHCDFKLTIDGEDIKWIK